MSYSSQSVSSLRQNDPNLLSPTFNQGLFPDNSTNSRGSFHSENETGESSNHNNSQLATSNWDFNDRLSEVQSQISDCNIERASSPDDINFRNLSSLEHRFIYKAKIGMNIVVSSPEDDKNDSLLDIHSEIGSDNNSPREIKTKGNVGRKTLDSYGREKNTYSDNWISKNRFDSYKESNISNTIEGNQDVELPSENYSELYLLCCILGCKRKASVRNFNSLKTTWEIKPEYKQDVSRLKICTTCYNVDLKRKKQCDNRMTKKRKRSASPPSHEEAEIFTSKRKRGAKLSNFSSFLENVGILFSLSQDAWLKYNLILLQSLLESNNFSKMVLYLENNEERYQLFDQSVLQANNDKHLFQWGKIVSPSNRNDKSMIDTGIPLILQRDCELIYKDLSWNDIAWGNSFVTICGKEFSLIRMKFIPITKLHESTELIKDVSQNLIKN